MKIFVEMKIRKNQYHCAIIWKPGNLFAELTGFYIMGILIVIRLGKKIKIFERSQRVCS